MNSQQKSITLAPRRARKRIPNSLVHSERRGVYKCIAPQPDNCREMDFSVLKTLHPLRVDSNFVTVICSIQKKLHRYINFGRVSPEELCILQAQLELSLLLIEYATYTEQRIREIIRGDV